MEGRELSREKGAPPLYYQIENQLREQIENEEFKYGDLFYSEKQLQEMYQVSRVTVRQAMNALVNAGYLECSRGVGTTVIFRKIDEQIKGVISFSDEMAKHGIVMQTGYCTISLEQIPPSVCTHLAQKEGSRAYKLVRVRCAGAEPVVYSITYIPGHYDLPLNSKRYLSSLYRFLRESYGIQIARGKDTFEAVLANETIAGFLDIPIGAPVFKRVRRTVDQEGQAVEYSVCYYNGDKYKYSMEL